MVTVSRVETYFNTVLHFVYLLNHADSIAISAFRSHVIMYIVRYA